MTADLQRAEMLMAVGRWNEAVNALHRELAADPDSVYALCLLASCEEERREYVPMLEAALLAVAADPEFTAAHLLVASAYGRLGRHEEAIAAAREAVRVGPDSWRCHYELANVFRRARKSPAALAAAQRARELAPPDEPAPHVLHALVAGDLGAYRDAETSLDQALAVAPNDPYAHNAVGYLHLRRGRVLRALRAFAVAGRQTPNWAVPAANVERGLSSLSWHLCIFTAVLVGGVTMAGLAGPGYRLLVGAALVVAYAGLVALTLYVLPGGVRTAMINGAAFRLWTWITAVLLGFALVQVIAPVSFGAASCVTTLAIIGLGSAGPRIAR